MGEINAAAIHAIANRARQADGKLVEIDGVTYSTVPLHDKREAFPEPQPLGLSTLASLVDYLSNDDLDGGEADREGVFVHVASPRSVLVLGSLRDYHAQRVCLVSAAAPLTLFSFGTWLTQDRFMTLVQALFEKTDRQLQKNLALR